MERNFVGGSVFLRDLFRSRQDNYVIYRAVYKRY